MSRSTIAARIALPTLMLGAGMACDYTGDFLFAGVVENVPGVMHIEGEDDLFITPVQADNTEDLRNAIIYGEIGPTGTAATGGATFNFKGTGGPVCIFVDPETVFWNWSIAPVADSAARIWNYPDNVFDDGDIDLFVGLSAYYTGSPGLTVGDFFVNYSDSLGNDVAVELTECTNIGFQGQTNAHAGRGFPEFCSLNFTDPGVSYTGLLQTFSTPLDDDRLGFGLLVYDGTCQGLITLATGVGAQQQADQAWSQECVITGESIIPRPIGANEVTYCTGEGCKDPWAGSIEFETEFCLGGQSDMRRFCRKEASDMFDAGIDCQIESIENPDARCYCGDEGDLPQPGAL